MPAEASIAAPAAPAPTTHVPSSNISPPSGESQSVATEGALEASYADLDGLAGVKPTQQSKPKTAPKAEENGDPEVPKVDPKPDKPKTDAKEQPKTPEKPQSPAAVLRQALEREKSTRIQLEGELRKLRDAKPGDHPDVKALQERVASAEKRWEEAQNELRFTNYERSEEYKAKYEKPFHNAYGHGREMTGELEIVERIDEATGNILQKGRPATGEDFDRVMAISRHAEASKLAKQLFGDDKDIVMNQRQRVLELNRDRLSAIEEFRKQGTEKFQKDAELQTKTRESRVSAWKEANQALETAFSKWLKPAEGDTEGNTLLEKAVAQADLAFSDDPKLGDADLAKLHALIRGRAIAFPRAAHMLTKAEARIAELEAELASFQASEPGEGQGDRGGGPETADSWEADLDKRATSR